MSFFSSIYRKVFGNDQEKQNIVVRLQSPICDPSNYSVKLQDIERLIVKGDDGKLMLEPIHLQLNTNTNNAQLKLIFTLHQLLLNRNSLVVRAVTSWIDNGEIKLQNMSHEDTEQPQQSVPIQARHNRTQTVNVAAEISKNGDAQHSMYLSYQDQAYKLTQIFELEQTLVQYYFNYAQRLSWGIDVLSSSRLKQYPYSPDLYVEARQKFLWLYKIINLLNYQISGVQLLKYNLSQTSVSTPLIKDIAAQIMSDCLIEYLFLGAELSEMIDSVSSLHVSDGNEYVKGIALQFYEIYQILREQTRVLKDFHSYRETVQHKIPIPSQVQWFHISKEQKRDLEDYISKIKFLHTGNFRKSLNIPSKNVALDALKIQLMQYQLDPKALKKQRFKAKDFNSTKHAYGQTFEFKNADDLNISYRQPKGPYPILSPQRQQNVIKINKFDDEDISIVEEHSAKPKTISENQFV